ncbi:MAG TPA: septum formation initiator family protein [Polyangia bacterium]|nr:septum formation initiator family protein [Polyangia bacterium]
MPAPGPRLLSRLALACALAVALGYLPHQIYGRTGLRRLIELRRSLADLHRRSEAARAEHARLRAQAAALKGDPRAVERVARDELGLVKKGDVIYQFPPAATAAARGEPAPP